MSELKDHDHIFFSSNIKNFVFIGTGDGTNTPIPPSNTPQTPAGGTASGDATPLNDRIDQRSESLHQVLEQMRSLVLREHLSLSSDNEEDTEDIAIQHHAALS